MNRLLCAVISVDHLHHYRQVEWWTKLVSYCRLPIDLCNLFFRCNMLDMQHWQLPRREQHVSRWATSISIFTGGVAFSVFTDLLTDKTLWNVSRLTSYSMLWHSDSRPKFFDCLNGALWAFSVADANWLNSTLASRHCQKLINRLTMLDFDWSSHSSVSFRHTTNHVSGWTCCCCSL